MAEPVIGDCLQDAAEVTSRGPLKRRVRRMGLAWLLAVLALCPDFSVQAASQTGTTGAVKPAQGLGPGAIFVLPDPGAEMPDLTNTLVSLKRGGYNPPGNQLELADGRQVVAGFGEGRVVLSRGTRTACESEETDPDALLLQALDGVDKELLLGEYEKGESLLKAAGPLLPCLRSEKAGELLYRAFFLQGMLGFGLNKQDEALAGFTRAVGINPDREWDNRYPPRALQIFYKAQKGFFNQQGVQLRQSLDLDGVKVLIDGAVLAEAPRKVARSVHLVQWVDRQGGQTSFLLDLSQEAEGATVWFSASAQLLGWQHLFEPESPPVLRALVLDAFLRAARDSGRRWLLLYQPNEDAVAQRVLYVDVTAGQVTEPPAGLYTSGQEVKLPSVAGRGGKTVKVPTALRGWQVGLGPQLIQQLNAPQGRYIGLELGGAREVTPALDARLALALAGYSTGGAALALHLGVRRTWELDPFSLFVEGGMLGCKCAKAETASLGAEVRGGTGYFFMDPLKQNGMEFTLGFGFLFSGEVLGQFGLTYQRGF